MIDLSIIIPVYNAEKYLDKCLDNIINQSFNNYEIILVNDGSTDNSEKIVDDYVNKYSNIIKINKKNGGPGAARDEGLKIARGNYISFVDSDDYVDSNMLSYMMNYIKKYNCDIAICGIYMFDDYTGKELGKIELSEENREKPLNREELITLYLNNKITGHLWNKIYKRSLLIKERISFSDTKYYEDMYPTLKILDNVKYGIYVDNCYYRYRQVNGSITKSYTEQHVVDYINAIKLCEEYVNNMYDKDLYDNYLKQFKLYNLNTVLKIYYKFKKYNRKNINKKFNFYFDRLNITYSLSEILINKNISNRNKVMYLLYKTKLLLYKEKLKRLIRR
ncbi:glycosyltransferase [Clostridium perfringens]